MCLCRTVRITRRATTVNAACRASTEWCEVSMTTANPALVPSPILTTSKLSAFCIALSLSHLLHGDNQLGGKMGGVIVMSPTGANDRSEA